MVGPASSSSKSYSSVSPTDGPGGGRIGPHMSPKSSSSSSFTIDSNFIFFSFNLAAASRAFFKTLAAGGAILKAFARARSKRLFSLSLVNDNNYNYIITDDGDVDSIKRREREREFFSPFYFSRGVQLFDVFPHSRSRKWIDCK